MKSKINDINNELIDEKNEKNIIHEKLKLLTQQFSREFSGLKNDKSDINVLKNSESLQFEKKNLNDNIDNDIDVNNNKKKKKKIKNIKKYDDGEGGGLSGVQYPLYTVGLQDRLHKQRQTHLREVASLQGIISEGGVEQGKLRDELELREKVHIHLCLYLYAYVCMYGNYYMCWI